MMRLWCSISLILLVVVPAQAQSPTAAGVWRGTYHCAQGETGLTLSIASEGGAFFKFYADPANPDVPTGCYVLRVVPTKDQRTVDLKPDYWVRQPANYYMVGLRGEMSADGLTMTGTVTDEYCTDFSLKRIKDVAALPTDCAPDQVATRWSPAVEDDLATLNRDPKIAAIADVEFPD